MNKLLLCFGRAFKQAGKPFAAILLLLMLIAGITPVAKAQNTLDNLGLSSATPSVGAYSLRKLSSSYTGYAIKVRRSSDNSTSDIGFSASGQLDLAALNAFVGSGTGYVDTWYDQSAGGYNMAQTLTSRQPVIVTAGVVEKVNGRPAIYFLGTYLNTINRTIFTQAATMVAFAKGAGGSSALITKTGTPAGVNANYPSPFDFTNSDGAAYMGDATGSIGSLSARGGGYDVSASTAASVYSFIMSASNPFVVYLDGREVGRLTPPGFADRAGSMMIGNRADGQDVANMRVSEMVMFNSYLSAERQIAETSQTAFYKNAVTNANLIGLSAPAGSLSPAFSKDTTAYILTTSNTATTFQLTPTADVTGVTITIKGVTTASGNTSAAIAFTNNEVVAIVVTAISGNTKTYNVKIIQGPAVPTVSTAVTGILTTSALLGGNITGDNGVVITGRGAVVATHTAPTTADIKVNNATPDFGSYYDVRTGLNSGTTYYVRAFATTVNGTYYGDEVSFTTLSVLDKIGLSSNARPAAVYSLRLMSSTYTGYAIKVRRDNGSVANIGFTTDGLLDISALKTFAGTGSAYVTTWYDQSGQKVDMTQDAAEKQPRIVNAGVIEMLNGRPSIYFGTNSLSTGKGILYDVGATVLAFARGNSSTPSALIFKTGASYDVGGGGGTGAGPFDFTDPNGNFNVGNIANPDFSFYASSPSNRFDVSSSVLPAIYSFTCTGGEVNPGDTHVYLNGDLKAAGSAGIFRDRGAIMQIGSTIESQHHGQFWVSEIATFDMVLAADDLSAAHTGLVNYYVTPGAVTNLTALTTSAGSLSPVFTAATTNYTLTVPASTANILVTPATETAAAVVAVNGTVIASGTASTPISLSGPNTVINITVTGSNGSATKTYVLNVSKSSAIAMSYPGGANVLSINQPIEVISPTTSGIIQPAGTYGASTPAAFFNHHVDHTATDISGNVYFSYYDTDVNNQTIYRKSRAGVLQAIFTGAVGVQGISVDNANGDVYFSEANTANGLSRVRKVAYGSNTATVAVQFPVQYPSSIALDGKGNLFVVVGNNTMYRYPVGSGLSSLTMAYSANGLYSLKADANGNIYYIIGGSWTMNVISQPNSDWNPQLPSSGGYYSLDIDPSGNIYVGSADGLLMFPQGATTPVTINATLNNNNFKEFSVDNEGLIYVPHITDALQVLTPQGGYYANFPLPEGVVFNSNTGSISGTPTTITAAKNYTVVAYDQDAYKATADVNIAVKADANLSALAIDHGALTPGFNTSVTSYTAIVESESDSIAVTPTVSTLGSIVAVDEVVVSSGTTQKVALSVGDNPIVVKVTAADGHQKNYTLTVTRPLPGVKTLAAIIINTGALDASFDPSVNTYTAAVSNTDTAFVFKPVLTDVKATITVNGATISGDSTFSVPLILGDNTVTIVVTAQDNSQNTYTITVKRPSVTTLASLTISAGTLNPVFDSNISDYTLRVPSATDVLNIVPVLTDNSASIKINDADVVNGNGYDVPLNYGLNNVQVVVTAQNGDAKTYTLAATRAISLPSSALSSLVINYAGLDFDPANYTYTVGVGTTATPFTITPTVANDGATIKINDSDVTSAEPFTPSLVQGYNDFNVVVTSADGSETATYLLHIYYYASADATLSQLTATRGTLTPNFDATILDYTITLPSTDTTIAFTAFPNAFASTQALINGRYLSYGQQSDDVPLQLGDNIIPVEVLAESGAKITYTVNVKLVTSQPVVFTTQPVSKRYYQFQPFTLTAVAENAFSYEWQMAFDDRLDFHEVGYYTYGGIADTGSSFDFPVDRWGGKEYVRLQATNVAGAHFYSDTITVETIDGDSRLSSLIPSTGTFDTAFDPEVLGGTITVPNEVSDITLTATAFDPNVQSFTYNGIDQPAGTSSPSIALYEGDNNITVSIKALGSAAPQVYNIKVVRTPTENTATLNGISLSAGSLNPVFANGVNNYKATVTNDVSSITLTPFIVFNGSTVTVNNINVIPGQASQGIPLSEGINLPVLVKVTSANGSVSNTYKVTITRHAVAAQITLQPVDQTGQSGHAATFTAATNTDDVQWEMAPSYNPTAFAAITNPQITGVFSNTLTIPKSVVNNYFGNMFRLVASNSTGLPVYSNSAQLIWNSSDDTMLSLTTNRGALSPAYDAAISNYTITVNAPTIKFNAVTADDYGLVMVELNGNSYGNIRNTNPGYSPDVPLAVGDNAITLTSISGDRGTRHAYTVTVTRPVTATATLESLAVNYRPAVAIDQSTGIFRDTVLEDNVMLTPIATDNAATITIAGDTVISGSGSPQIPLAIGDTDIPIVIRSSDGSTVKTYTARITRTVPGSSTGLKSLATSFGRAAVYDAGTGHYSLSLSKGQYSPSTYYFTIVTADPYARAGINGGGNAVYLDSTATSMTVDVTAADGVTTQSYVVDLTMYDGSDGADFSSLTYTTASKTVAVDLNEYTQYITVDHADKTISFTATAKHPENLYLIIGNENGVSGVASSAMPLNPGLNVYNVIVASPDGLYSHYYNMRITRPTSVLLTSLSPGVGTLSPAFSPADTAYTMDVPASTTGIRLNTTLDDANAKLTVNGISSGNTSGVILLSYGENVITMVVGAAPYSDDTKTYTLTVNRALPVSRPVLFTTQPVSKRYYQYQPFTLTAVTENAVSYEWQLAFNDGFDFHDVNYYIYGGGVFTTGNTLDFPAGRWSGKQYVRLQATNVAGEHFYSDTITVETIDNDSRLASLTPGTGTFSTAFNPDVFNYTLTVPNEVSDITLTGATLDPNIPGIVYNGTEQPAGAISQSIALYEGENTITVKARLYNASTVTQPYTVKVIRTPTESTATLNGISLSSGSLSPAFSNGVSNYKVEVTNDISSITLTPFTAFNGATVTVNNNNVIPGQASQSIQLGEGVNLPVLVKVRSANGNVSATYKVTVTRHAVAAQITLQPTDQTESYGHAATFTAAANTDNVQWQMAPYNNPTAFAAITNAQITGVFSNTLTIPKSVVNNYFGSTFRLVASNSTGLPVYSNSAKLIWNRSNDTLLSLTTNRGALSPAYDAAIASYTMTVIAPNIKFNTVTADDNGAVNVSLNGNGYGSIRNTNPGYSPEVPLAIGDNVITLTSVSPDGNTRHDYTITVTRPATATATLESLAVNYRAAVPVDQSTGIFRDTLLEENVTLTPVATDNAATITIAGDTVISGSGSPQIPLAIGDTDIPIVIRSSDGSTVKTYTARITRTVPGSNTGLKSLATSFGRAAVYDAGNGHYSLSLSKGQYSPSTYYFTIVTTDPYARAGINGGGNAVYLDSTATSMTVDVKAADGVTTQSYVVDLTMYDGSDGADFSSLTYTTASKAVAVDLNEYTQYITVDHADKTISFTATAKHPENLYLIIGNENGVSGVASSAMPLNPGLNVYNVIVASPDGLYSHYYNMRITRPTSVLLTSLSPGVGTLSPAFSPADTAYTMDVPASTTGIRLNTTLDDANAKLTVNGISSGNTSGVILLSYGENVITMVVGASPYSDDTKTYTLTVNRALPGETSGGDATLTRLATTGGFSVDHPSATEYTTSLGYGVSSIGITPTTADPLASITVNGVRVASGTISTAISPDAAAGSLTTVPIVVTAADGVTIKNYTLTIIRGSTGSTLSKIKTIELVPASTLTQVAGPLSEYQFSPAPVIFTTSVAATVNQVSVKTFVQEPHATVKVEGVAVAIEALSAPVVLSGDTTLIHIDVTAQDGITVKHITVKVGRKGSSNANLSSIQLSPLAVLSNSTGTANVNYNTSVNSATTQVAITPVAEDAGATIRVAGHLTTSGTASVMIPLNSTGTTTIRTEVTAADGVSKRTYDIVVSKNGSSNVKILSLALNPVSVLTQTSTGPANVNYTTSVTAGTESVTLTATLVDAGAKLKINNVTVSSGTASAPIMLNAIGVTMISVEVTGEDGITKRTNSIAVSRAGSSNVKIGLGITPTSTLTLIPNGVSGAYQTSVDAGTTSITVIPKAEDANAVIRVEGSIVASGTASAAVPLTVGTGATTTVHILVTGQDGVTTRTYSILVYKNGSSFAKLQGIRLNPASVLKAAAGAADVNYATSVAAGTTSVKVAAVAYDVNSVIRIEGVITPGNTESAAITLNAGPTTIHVQVTAADGVTTKTYEVVVSRKGSSNVNLKGIILDPASSLTLGTGSSYVNYLTSVVAGTGTVRVSPVAEDPTAVIRVNNVVVASGGFSDPITLNSDGSPTLINLLVKGQDNETTRTYSITVNRNGSSNYKLKTLQVSPSSPVEFVSRTYSTTVPYSQTSIQVRPTAAEAGATIKVGTELVISGGLSSSIALQTGVNNIPVEVTAPDGKSVITYTVQVTREAGQPFPFNSIYTNATDIAPKVEGLTVHQAVSPNGDGQNDVLTIEGVENYSDNHLSIMNTGGQLIFETRNYNTSGNVFDGHSNKTGIMQKPGTYYYSLEYKDGNSTKRKTGYIILKY